MKVCVKVETRWVFLYLLWAFLCVWACVCNHKLKKPFSGCDLFSSVPSPLSFMHVGEWLWVLSNESFRVKIRDGFQDTGYAFCEYFSTWCWWCLWKKARWHEANRVQALKQYLTWGTHYARSFLVCVFVCLGKVAVKKEDLQKYHGKDTWFQLQPVSADSEVQVSMRWRN